MNEGGMNHNQFAPAGNNMENLLNAGINEEVHNSLKRELVNPQMRPSAQSGFNQGHAAASDLNIMSSLLGNNSNGLAADVLKSQALRAAGAHHSPRGFSIEDVRNFARYFFEKYDSNKSGTMEWPEFQACFRDFSREVGIMLSDSQIYELFALFDYDRNYYIKIGEFVAMVEMLCGMRRLMKRGHNPEFVIPKV